MERDFPRLVAGIVLCNGLLVKWVFFVTGADSSGRLGGSLGGLRLGGLCVKLPGPRLELVTSSKLLPKYPVLPILPGLLWPARQ